MKSHFKFSKCLQNKCCRLQICHFRRENAVNDRVTAEPTNQWAPFTATNDKRALRVITDDNSEFQLPTVTFQWAFYESRRGRDRNAANRLQRRTRQLLHKVAATIMVSGFFRICLSNNFFMLNYFFFNLLATFNSVIFAWAEDTKNKFIPYISRLLFCFLKQRAS
jgi:hypothetical protein